MICGNLDNLSQRYPFVGTAGEPLQGERRVGRLPDGQELVTCVQEAKPTAAPALALCIGVYFPCTMFHKRVH